MVDEYATPPLLHKGELEADQVDGSSIGRVGRRYNELPVRSNKTYETIVGSHQVF